MMVRRGVTSMVLALVVLAYLFGLNSSFLMAEEKGGQSKVEQKKQVEKLILPAEIISIQGKSAFLFQPTVKAKTAKTKLSPRPWVFYGVAILPRYPDSHEKWMHEQFLKAGIAVAGVDVGEAYGSPASQKYMDGLYEEMVRRGYSKKPCLLGRSRGGLWVSSWAVRHPKKVAGIAGIYPVFDLTSYPGLKRAAPQYQMTAEELGQKLCQHNPIEKASLLIKEKIPIYIIHGKDDKVVPLEKNSAELQRRYQKGGVGHLIEVQVIPGQGHNYWPGFFRSEKLIQFVIQRANGRGVSSSKEKK